MDSKRTPAAHARPNLSEALLAADYPAEVALHHECEHEVFVVLSGNTAIVDRLLQTVAKAMQEERISRGFYDRALTGGEFGWAYELMPEPQCPPDAYDYAVLLRLSKQDADELTRLVWPG